MKILGYDIAISRSKKAAEPTPTPYSVSIQKNLQKTDPSLPLKSSFPRAELGDSGTRLLHGIIIDEYNAQLQGVQGIRVYEEMRKSDGTVRAAVLACTLPIRRATYFVNPATNSDQDKEIANFVEHALFDWLDITWDDVIRQALLMVPFGVMLFEKVYGIKNHDGKDYVTLTKLAPRLPKSILQWELVDHTFGIQQIRQDGVLAQIPGSKLLIFVNEREGDNWWGNSMIRPAYRHWYVKDNLYKIDAISIERQTVGVPYVKMPQGYTEADEAKAQKAAQNLRANESSFAVIPTNYEIGFLDMGAHTTRDPIPSIEHHDKQILLSVLAQFLSLGQTKTGSGSRALSSDHSDLFLKGIEAIANTIVDEFNKNLIPELVDMNFNDVKVYPVLDYSGISKVDVQALGDAYSKLSTAGAISPTQDDEQYLRSAMGLPPRTQEDIDEAADEEPSTEELLDHANIEDTGEPNPPGPQEQNTDQQKEKVNDAAKQQEDTKPTPQDKKGVNKGVKQVKEKPAPQKASEWRKLPRTFSNGKGFMSWRPLTMAESKVKFDKLQNTMDAMEATFTAAAVTTLNDAKNSFIQQVMAALQSNNTKALQDLEFKFENEYSAILKNTMDKAYSYGKQTAATEIGLASPPANDVAVGANIDLMAKTIAAKTMTDLETKAKLAAADAVKNGASPIQSAGEIDADLEEAIKKFVDTTAGTIVNQNINNGRNDVFSDNANDIHGLQRSEVLDDVTCNFCLSMDGLVVEPDDPWAQTDTYHTNDRGIWVAILKDEENPPDITGVPDRIAQYYDGHTNALIQPPKPIVRPGSAAAAEVERRNNAKK